MEHLGDVGHVESHFSPFGDCVSVGSRWCTICAKCATSLEIVLDAPDRTLGDEAKVIARSVWR